jgi:trimeric autotransporter adhesin
MAMFFSIVRTIRSLAIVSASIVLSSATLPAQTAAQSVVPSRIVSTIDENSRVALHGYVSPLANAANDRGAAPDSMPLTRMHLVLKRSPDQETSLQQFISTAHTAGSANYHKWLTPEQFGQQYGPSDQDIATVESWLSSHGFAVSGVEPGKQVIEFSGNVAQLRSAFHAQIRKYEVNGNTHFATANEPDIPAALAPVVGGFASLNDFLPKKLMARRLGTASYDPKTDKATPNWTYGNSSGVSFVLAPGDFGIQYDLPNSTLNSKFTGTTLDGTGETIAILDFANINVDLANQFRSMFGLPANPPNIIIDGNDPGIDGINNPDGENGASIESYLDVEWAGAVAPKATIDLVIAADTALESGGILAAEHAVYGDIAPVISVSIDVGGCEQEAGSINAFINGLWEQAAAQGQTVVVAAGDSGAAGCDDDNTEEYAINGLGVNSWASTPFNVAAGGTDFYYSSYASSSALNTQLGTYWNTTPSQNPSVSILGYIPEQPWNDSQYGLDAVNYYTATGATSIVGGSGGASSSAVCSTGSYNSTTGACTGTVSGYAKPSWQTGTGVPADKVRDIPDISLFAADGLNYSYYPICASDGDCQSPGGSSLYQITGVGGTSAAAPTFAGIMALVNQQYGAQGQANFVLYPLKAQFPAAFHDITNGTNSEPCNVSSIDLDGSIVAPLDCIAVKSPVTITDPTYGIPVTEGELGTGSTPDYNAAAGYNLATGLGSVDASVLLSDWNKVSFTTTGTTLTPSSTSFTHGTAITISGAVTGGTGTPTGAVALMTSSTEPLQQGVASFALTSGAFSATNVNYLPGGTYNIWGRYGGDGTNAASSSTPVSITVAPEASTTVFDVLNSASASTASVIASGTSVPYGTQLILAAQTYGSTYYTTCVTTNSTSAGCASYGTPTGTVQFTDNGTTINTAVINAEGDAEFNGAYYVGSHAVTANYSGDNSYAKSSGTAINFTVAKDAPILNVYTSYANSSGQFPSGQADVLTIIVQNSANVVQLSNGTLTTETGYPYTVPAATPTGTVTISGITGLTTATLAPGVDPATGAAVGIATVTVPTTAATGTANVTFSYAGDANYSSTSITGSIPFASAGGTA